MHDRIYDSYIERDVWTYTEMCNYLHYIIIVFVNTIFMSFVPLLTKQINSNMIEPSDKQPVKNSAGGARFGPYS